MSLNVSPSDREGQTATERLAAAPEAPSAPVTVVLESADELVNLGLREMLVPYADRITLEHSLGAGSESVVRLIDPYGEGPQLDLRLLLTAGDEPGLLVVYTWHPVPERSQFDTLVSAVQGRLRGWLSTKLSAADLVSALEHIHEGDIVIGDGHPLTDVPTLHGLSQREQDVIILITAGLSNKEIAEQAHLAINTVKTHIRSCYRKLDVTSRSQAVLWGVAHGLALGPGRFWEPRAGGGSGTPPSSGGRVVQRNGAVRSAADESADWRAVARLERELAALDLADAAQAAARSASPCEPTAESQTSAETAERLYANADRRRRTAERLEAGLGVAE